MANSKIMIREINSKMTIVILCQSTIVNVVPYLEKLKIFMDKICYLKIYIKI